MAKAHGTVRVARIYDEPTPDDGRRILVDRLWPRGVSKERAQLDDWCKGIAPSNELRRWYGHAPERFEEFSARYRAELSDGEPAEALSRIAAEARTGVVTLLTATKAPEISEAGAEERHRRPRSRPRVRAVGAAQLPPSRRALRAWPGRTTDDSSGFSGGWSDSSRSVR